MGLRDVYYYLFYKLYKFGEFASSPTFWSDVKAIISIIILEAFTVMAFLGYYKSFVNKSTHIIEEKWVYILTGILCAFINYYLFLYKDKWKQIVYNFDKWPKRKNEKGNLIVGVVIFALILNFILSMYFYLR